MNIGKILDWNDIFGAIVPLYVAIGLGFASVYWWKIFTLEQCSGINWYVAEFAIPFLVLDMLFSTDIYTMNFHVIVADSLQKLVILAALFLGKSLSKDFSFEWVITLFSLSTFTNNLLMGVPLLGSMYGEGTTSILIQIVVIQCVIWLNILMAMYEYRAVRLLIEDKFPEIASSIASIKLEAGISLSGREPLETNVEIDVNGMLNMVVRTSSVHSSTSIESFGSIHSAHEPKSSSCAKDTFCLQSLERVVTRNPSSVSTRTPNYIRQISNNSIIPYASVDVDVLVGHSKPSLQQEITLKCPIKNLDRGDGIIKEKAPGGVLIKLILISLWRKLRRNPITYASVIGIVWSLIAFRFNIKTPLIIKGSITLISKTGIGMAMFSLGLSIALQPKFMASKISTTVMCTVVKFLVGPAIMAIASAFVGLKGVTFQVVTIQAALPTAIVSFVYAKQHNVHPEIFSTLIIISTVIFLPVTIAYFLLLQHYP